MAPDLPSAAKNPIAQKISSNHKRLGNEVKKTTGRADRDKPSLTIDTAAAKLPVVYRRIEKQLTRNLTLNARGIQALPTKSPALNRSVQYRRYPPCGLGYDPQDPPPFVCMRQPGRQTGEQHEWFSEHPYRDHLSLTNLPDNLFLLEKGGEDPLVNVKVPEMADEYGHIVVNCRGRALRFFSFLPRYISQKVPGYVLEYWFRLDPRLEPSDIIDRMQPNTSSRKNDIPLGNAISMRRQRFRALLHAKSAQPGRIDPCRNEVEFLSVLTADQILLNTTMWVAEGTLWIPRMNSFPVEIVDWIDTGFPLNYFLDVGPPVVPSPRMELSILLRHRLQSQALSLGFGNREDNWTALELEDQPSRWHDRGIRSRTTQSGKRKSNQRDEDEEDNDTDYVDFKGKRKAVEIDGLTHDEWLAKHRTRLEMYNSTPQKPPRRARIISNDDAQAGQQRVGPSQDMVVNPAERGARRKNESHEGSRRVDQDGHNEDGLSESEEEDPVFTGRRASFGDFLLPQERTMAIPDSFRRRTIVSQPPVYVDLTGDTMQPTTRYYPQPLPPHLMPRQIFAINPFGFPQVPNPFAHRESRTATSTMSTSSGDSDGLENYSTNGSSHPPPLTLSMPIPRSSASASAYPSPLPTAPARATSHQEAEKSDDEDVGKALLEAAARAAEDVSTDESDDENGREMSESLQTALNLGGSIVGDSEHDVGLKLASGGSRRRSAWN